MTTKRAVLYTALTLAAIAVLSMDARAEEPKSAPAPVVNINTASPEQLAYLPGIGKTLAARIHDFAEMGGKDGAACDHKCHIKTVEDLLKVEGIGPAKLAKIRPYVVFEGPTTATSKIRVPKDGAK